MTVSQRLGTSKCRRNRRQSVLHRSLLRFGFLLSLLAVAQDRRSAGADLKAHPDLSLFSLLLTCLVQRATFFFSFLRVEYRNTEEMVPPRYATSRFTILLVRFLPCHFSRRLLHISTFTCNILHLRYLDSSKSVTAPRSRGTQLSELIFALLFSENQTL